MAPLVRILVLAAVPLALARTDLAGCTYTDLVIKPTQQAAYASRLYYVPDTGEVCALLDCGGGRAPPKSTVPGCPLYTGTETYQPSYINPQTLGKAGSSVAMATAPVTPTAADTTTTAASTTAPATAQGSVTILTGTNTPSSTAASSAAGGASTSKTAAASASSSSSSAAKTTSTSSAAGAMQTVGAVLPCVVAAIAAGLA
ncbi:siderophore biosynthesis enzyme, putative [Cordyceps militaris CM01]|uniref:Siderophore biosynthesis enzyme, putative n=1 Tax=Cordyceps militaris (strain CM01) TaxID=983644 RepID=G3JAQ4_CORMM|nr:siderophore biosynthesis enzyme, putative [Cordyceps militaris CM01]EGX95169.1 siderophore biosynthesis enzyme, putative [Cordyceps militaris CM01]